MALKRRYTDMATLTPSANKVARISYEQSSPNSMTEPLSLDRAVTTDIVFKQLAILAPVLGSLNREYRQRTLRATSDALQLSHPFNIDLPTHVTRLLLSGDREQLTSLLRALPHLWASKEAVETHVMPLWKALAPVNDRKTVTAAAKMLYQVQMEIKPDSALSLPLGRLWLPLFKSIFEFDNADLLDVILVTGVISCSSTGFNMVPNKVCSDEGIKKAKNCLLAVAQHVIDSSTPSWSADDTAILGKVFAHFGDMESLYCVLVDPRATAYDPNGDTRAHVFADFIDDAFRTNNVTAMRNLLSWSTQLKIPLNDETIDILFMQTRKGTGKTMALLCDTLATVGCDFIITNNQENEPLPAPLFVARGQDPKPLFERFNLYNIAKDILANYIKPTKYFSIFMLALGKFIDDEHKRKLVDWAIEQKREATNICATVKRLVYPNQQIK